MPAIQSPEDAQFVASKIRDGTLTGARKDVAFQALQSWQSGQVQGDSPQAQEERLNFAQRVGKDMENRRAILTDITTASIAGEQSYAEGVVQVAAIVGAGAALDMIGEAMVSAGRGLAEITPDMIGGPIKAGATWAAYEFLNTDIGMAAMTVAREGMKGYNKFQSENPRAARNVESVVNIALLAAPVKGKPKAPPTAAGRAGTRALQASVKQSAQQRKAFVDDLISPKPTKKVREAEVSRTAEGGLLRQKIVALAPGEKEIAAQVAKVPGIGPKKTLQGNWNVLQTAVRQEDKRLAGLMETQGNFIFTKAEFNAELKMVLRTLQGNPLIVGDAAKTAQRMIIKMRDLAYTGKMNGSGLLRARKDFDIWVRRQKGDKAFNPELESAMSIALREVRDATNNFIINRARSVNVEQSLKKQSLMIRGLENIAPKAADEGGNIILRAWQNVMKVLPIRGEFNQVMATIFGVGGLGASSLFAPWFTKAVGTAIGARALYKVATGPGGKKATGVLLKGIDQAIRKTRDANLIRTLRADRAVILEMAKTAESEALPE